MVLAACEPGTGVRVDSNKLTAEDPSSSGLGNMPCSAFEPLHLLLDPGASGSRSMVASAAVGSNPAQRLTLTDARGTVTCAASLAVTLRGSYVAGYSEGIVQIGSPSTGERWQQVPCCMARVEDLKGAETCRTVLRKRAGMHYGAVGAEEGDRAHDWFLACPELVEDH